LLYLQAELEKLFDHHILKGIMGYPFPKLPQLFLLKDFLILGLNSFISLEEIFVVFPVSLIAAGLSFIPGGVGVFEGGMIGLFVLFNIPYDVAVTAIILIRLLSTGLFTAIGMICLKIISKE